MIDKLLETQEFKEIIRPSNLAHKIIILHTVKLMHELNQWVFNLFNNKMISNLSQEVK